jgi:hypothetical protein
VLKKKLKTICSKFANTTALFMVVYVLYIYFQKMSDKGTKALQTANNNRISTLVWKLHRAIENAIERDIPFTEVDGSYLHVLIEIKL